MGALTSWQRVLFVGVLAVATAATSCTDASPAERSGSEGSRSTTASTTTTTAVPAVWTATVTGEQEVNGGYRQGLARSETGTGWIFSTNDALYRTDDDHVPAVPPVQKAEPAIPPELKAGTYDHVGDVDVADGMIWVPMEKADKKTGEQVLARYDAESFAFVDSFVVPQHHAAFVTVDEDGVIYSADEFGDDTLLRYRLEDGALEPLEPLVMSRLVERIQGADATAGAVWLSTDDDHNGIYRVDLATGEVQDVGSTGYVDGEGEGLDAEETDGDDVLLWVMSCDPALVPVRVIALRATPSS